MREHDTSVISGSEVRLWCIAKDLFFKALFYLFLFQFVFDFLELFHAVFVVGFAKCSFDFVSTVGKGLVLKLIFFQILEH